MSLFFRGESRSIGADDVSWDRGGARLMAGSAEAALRLIPVYAATTGIADDIATTPVHAYRSSEAAGNVRLPRQPALLTDPGIEGLSWIAWATQALMSLLLRGFALGLIVARDSNGWATKVVWVHPDRVQIDESRYRPVVLVDGRPVSWVDAVYIPAAVMPGSIVGLSPVSLFRLQLTKGQAAERYAADFFDRGIMPPGILRNTKKELSDGQADRAKARFKASVSGRDVFVAGSDWEWSTLTVPSDDVAFLETIKATATQVAAIYRVAPEDIGGTTTGGSMTYATLEMNELKRIRRALMPWGRRFEDALSRLLPRPQYVKFNFDALARADLKTRMESHEIALRIGMETNDEGRALEDRPPLSADQVTQWQNLYGARKGQPVTTGGNA